MKVRQIEQAWVEAMPKTSLPPKKRLKQWAGSSTNWALTKAIDITAARVDTSRPPRHAGLYCAEVLRRLRGSNPRVGGRPAKRAKIAKPLADTRVLRPLPASLRGTWQAHPAESSANRGVRHQNLKVDWTSDNLVTEQNQGMDWITDYPRQGAQPA
jgi:hypothetical protein